MHSSRIIVSARGVNAINGNDTKTTRVETLVTPKSGNNSRAGTKNKAEYTILISGNRKLSKDKLESMCNRFRLVLGNEYDYSLPVDYKDKYCKLSFKTEDAFNKFVASFNKFHEDLETDVEEHNLLPILNRFTIIGYNNGNVFRYTCRPEEIRNFNPIKEMVRLRLISISEAEKSTYRWFPSGEGFIYLPDYKSVNSTHFIRLTEIKYKPVRSGFISLTQPLLGVSCPDPDSRTHEGNDKLYAHRNYGTSPTRSGILHPTRDEQRRR
jgi:hypothetical protein